MSTRYVLTSWGRVAVALAMVVTVVVMNSFVQQSAALADSDGASHSPVHVWVDPTQPDVNGDYTWSATIHMPPLVGRAVVHAQAPAFVDGPVHCQAPRPEDGGVLTCVGTGAPIPGEYDVAVELKQEGGPGYSWSIPVTVCPLTGCSDLFSLSISPSPIVIWANPTITDQTFGFYNFNVDWNALEVRIPNLVDAHGAEAPGIHDPVSELPGNGAKFGYRGTFTTPGTYFMTVTVVDEFGGEHSADVTVRVCTPEACADLLTLPDTGIDTVAFVAIGAFAAVAIVAGVLVLILRRRNNG